MLYKCERLKLNIKMYILVYISIVSVFLILVKSHPQCLDFRPPFESKHRLLFCTEYKDFGCCSQRKDSALANQYTILLPYIQKDGLGSCEEMMKDILCQECSPYAAHIYDAEETLIKRPFPGLCKNYCYDFYSKCSGIVEYLSSDKQLLASLKSIANFCSFVSLSDKDYCYPELLTNNVLNGDISRDAITQTGCLCLEPFAGSLRNPLLLESPPDDTQRLFIAEQLGVVYVYYKNGTKLDKPFLNLTDIVDTSPSRGDERGFLGLAFHPNFTDNQRIYMYYSIKNRKQHQIRISEILTSRYDPNVADKKSERILFEIDQPYLNHNGGEILFGADGYLYCFVGDGGAGGDPRGYAQNKSVLLGKVLRIDVDSTFDPGLPYKIPRDNPFYYEPKSRPEIYAYGIRNIWRCDVDEGDILTGYGKGRIICGDVGQNAFEEVDIIEKGGNYGWNSREGFHCYKDKLCGKIGLEILPIHEYPHTVGKSVTGGHVYRGCMNPNLQGKYVFGDYVNGKMFTLEENLTTKKWESKDLTMCGPELCFNGLTAQYGVNIMSFGEDDDGEIYMLTTNFASTIVKQGVVYKLVDPRRRGDPTNCRSHIVNKKIAHEPVASKGTIPFGNNGWQFSWMPVTTCIMMPAWKCYHYFL